MTQINVLIGQHLENTKLRINEKLQESGIVLDLKDCFDQYTANELGTEYRRKKFIKSNFSYVVCTAAPFILRKS